MSLQKKLLLISVLVFLVLILGIVFFKKTQQGDRATNVDTTPPVVKEEKLESVIPTLQDTSISYVIGDIVSVQGDMITIQLSPKYGYDTERTVSVQRDKKTLMLSVVQKDAMIFSKEIRVFTDNNNQGHQPKSYTEKEIGMNDIKVGQNITAVSFDEVSDATTSFTAKSLVIQENLFPDTPHVK